MGEIPVREFTSGAEVLAYARARAERKRLEEMRIRREKARQLRIEKSPEPVQEKPVCTLTVDELLAEYREIDTPQSSGGKRKYVGMPPMKRMIYMFAESHGLTYGDLVGPSRNRAIVEARHDVIALLKREFPTASLPTIGRAMNRDHTSILHALRKRGFYPDYNGVKSEFFQRQAA